MPNNKAKSGSEVVVREPSIIDIIGMAVQKLEGEGAEATVAVIERLVDLKIKTDKIQAEQEFNKALAEFQNDCPPIKKASIAKITTKSGSNFSYKYAELDEIARTVKPFLFHRGLSFTWDSETIDGFIKTACFLRHQNGHSIKASFQAPIPKEIGSMSEIQIHATVLTYIKRQTLVEVLGLTTTEVDTDGASPETLDGKQLKILNAKIKKSDVDLKKLLKFMEVEKLEDIRKVDYPTVFYALEAKTSQAEKPVTQPSESEQGKML
jgi:hypothetical protein